MSEEITLLLRRCEQGDEQALAALFQVYIAPLTSLVRARIPRNRSRVDDEEDVALSAMNSFFDGLSRRRFADLTNRDNLWRLLLTITLRKLAARRRRDLAAKRGGGAAQGESAVHPPKAGESGRGFDVVADAGLAPGDAVLFQESCQALLGRLDDVSKRIALRKLEGYSNAEIAAELRCAERTVERKIQRIRASWKSSFDAASNDGR